MKNKKVVRKYVSELMSDCVRVFTFFERYLIGTRYVFCIRKHRIIGKGRREIPSHQHQLQRSDEVLAFCSKAILSQDDNAPNED